MKHINLIEALYVCKIDQITDLLMTIPVLELSSIKIDGKMIEVSVVTVENKRVITSINNLYNSRTAAETACTQYNKSIWTQD